jgi:hypothetical protein
LVGDVPLLAALSSDSSPFGNGNASIYLSIYLYPLHTSYAHMYKYTHL